MIDGAKVIAWAWSGEQPFGLLRASNGPIAIEIFGFAICQYAESPHFYRFSCDKAWETQQDDEYPSVAEAQRHLPPQYDRVTPHWLFDV